MGSNLVRELLKQDYQVRAFVEPGTRMDTLRGLDLEIMGGNILNEEDLKKAAGGCGVIVHTAASTNIWPSRSPFLGRINIDGTINVVRAAHHAGIDKLIYVGTANSFGYGSKSDPGNETKAYRSGKYKLDYMDTKLIAQRIVLDEVKANKLPAVIVNPTFMIGPYDSKPGSGSLILAVYNSRLPGYASGGRNYIHVRDVADGICRAIQNGRIGECYIMGHRNLSYREMFNKIAGILEVPPPFFNFPEFMIKAYGLLGSLNGRFRNAMPSVSYTMARIACDQHYYSSEKAIRHLGLPQTPIELAIMEAFQWFRSNGYLKIV